MQQFFRYFWRHKLPRKDVIIPLLKRPLSWQGVILYALLIGLTATIYIGIIFLNSKTLVTVPARGGTVVEGMIGAPRLVNPVLASTETDVALTHLLFSGLMKETNQGTLEPDLASHVETSTDGRTYTFRLREDLRWSDGKPLTAADIVFTYSKRALFESNSYWQQVSVTSPDSTTVVFALPASRSDFLALTTLGIIPMHIWTEVADDAFESDLHNLAPVGSGPFRFVRLVETNGIAQEAVLKRNRRYAGNKSYLDRYVVRFFANQEDLVRALDSGDIMLTGSATPETAHQAEGSYLIDTIPSTTTVGLFESKTATLFAPATLAILNQSIDKQAILATIEYGYGTLLDSARLSPTESLAALHSLGYSTRADGTLEKNSIPVAFAVAVENDPATLHAAQLFASQLQELGITAVLKAFDQGRFQDIIQHTEYQFFFGKVSHAEDRTSYRSIIPLYTSSYPLIHDARLHIPIDATLARSIDRYRESNEWYLRTNNVWKIFAN
jgi:peptide/nickel transport system substrate-binding protein